MQTIKTARKRGPTVVSRHQVYQVIVDNFCANPSVPTSRTEISRQLCVTYDVVDLHVKRLKDDGKIRLVINGVFAPTQIRPDRAVSFTLVPGGESVLEMADVVLNLSPGEVRNIRNLLGGIALEDLVAELRATRRELA